MPTRRTAKNHTQTPPHYAALAYDGLCTFEFGIVVELFGLSRPELNSWYSFEVCGLERGPLRATGGVDILPRKRLNGSSEADTIIVAGWRNPDERPPQRLIRALVAAHERGARLVSICSGIFVMAATGLLNNKRATTHWRYIDEVRRRFPQLSFRPMSRMSMKETFSPRRAVQRHRSVSAHRPEGLWNADCE